MMATFNKLNRKESRVNNYRRVALNKTRRETKADFIEVLKIERGHNQQGVTNKIERVDCRVGTDTSTGDC